MIIKSDFIDEQIDNLNNDLEELINNANKLLCKKSESTNEIVNDLLLLKTEEATILANDIIDIKDEIINIIKDNEYFEDDLNPFNTLYDEDSELF